MPRTEDALTADDRAQLAAMTHAEDPRALARLVLTYYTNLDRAERTPRGLLYMHLGLLAARLDRLARTTATRSRNGDPATPPPSHRRDTMPESPFTAYRKKQLAEMRPYVDGESMAGISVSPEDAKAGSPKPGDMIARNPNNVRDQWLVAHEFFRENYVEVTRGAGA